MAALAQAFTLSLAQPHGPKGPRLLYSSRSCLKTVAEGFLGFFFLVIKQFVIFAKYMQAEPQILEIRIA